MWLCFFRSSNVTLQHLRIEGCETHSIEGLFHIDAVDNVLLDNIYFEGNKNSVGPSCISGTNSSVTLRNISAAGNMGVTGGFLRMMSSTVVISRGGFHGNIGDNGGALLLFECNLDVKGAWFEENLSHLSGGAIYIEVGY